MEVKSELRFLEGPIVGAYLAEAPEVDPLGVSTDPCCFADTANVSQICPDEG